MTSFPTQLSTAPVQLDFSSLSEGGQVSASFLKEQGYSVQLGVTESDIEQLSHISLQASIRNYCPNDCTKRFKDVETARHWIEKGRLAFILKADASGEIAAYGWSGPSTDSHIPDGTLTGALRVSELHQGRGLATPFLAVVLDYTTKTWPSDVLWYESWKSNAGAIHIYTKLGFELVDSVISTRETDTGKIVEDTRLYMRLRRVQS